MKNYGTFAQPQNPIVGIYSDHCVRLNDEENSDNVQQDTSFDQIDRSTKPGLFATIRNKITRDNGACQQQAKSTKEERQPLFVKS